MPLTRIRGSVLCKIQLILSAKLFIGHFLFEFLLLFQLFYRENDPFYETCQIFKECSTNFSFVCFKLNQTQLILITNCSLGISFWISVSSTTFLQRKWPIFQNLSDLTNFCHKSFQGIYNTGKFKKGVLNLDK